MAKKRKKRSQSSARPNKLSRNRRGVLLTGAVLVLLTGVLTFGSLSLKAKNEEYKAQEAELKTQIQEEQARSQEVEQFQEYVKTDDYIKDIAEDKLGLVDPNEIIFKPTK